MLEFYFAPPLRKGLEKKQDSGVLSSSCAKKQDGALKNKMAASLATVANGSMLRRYHFPAMKIWVGSTMSFKIAVMNSQRKT